MRVVVVTVTVAVIVAIAAGAVPALRAYHADVLAVLRPVLPRSGPRRLLGVRGLVSVQSAFGLVLVVGAAATVPAFLAITVGAGTLKFDDVYLLSVRHDPAAESSELLSTPAGVSRVRAVLETLRDVPGVARVAATTSTILTTGPSGASPFWRIHGLEGRETGVSATFLQALDVPVLAGRTFDEAEIDGHALVAVLNESGVRALWPGIAPGDAVGRTIRTADGSREVIGVVRDFRSHPAAAIVPELLLPISAVELGPRGNTLPVIVRMTPGQAPDRTLVEQRLRERLPGIRASIVSVVEAQRPERIQPRFLAVLFGSLASLTLGLVAAGLYGITTFEIAQRRREMSIRLALGATARDLRRRVVGMVLTPVVLGSLAGCGASWWAGSALSSVIAHVSVDDPRAYVTGFVTMVSVALVAALVPALRLSRVSPSDALRQS
jgi:hypothetical protein